MSQLSKKLQELNANGLSNRKIADRATSQGHPIHHATVARYMRGEHPQPPKIEALEAIALGMGVPLSVLEQAASTPFTQEPFKLPRKADTLNDSERAVILSMIDALVDAKTPQNPVNTPAGLDEPVDTADPDFHPEQSDVALAANHDPEARARIDWLDSLGEEPQD